MSGLKQKLETGRKVFTAEITPPKGAGIKKLVKNAELLRPFVDAINITDCQRALVKMSSLAACRILEDQGIESVYQLTCRDRNAIALQSDLMGASALGIKNLLCLTGDPVKTGDSPDSKSVFEMESVGLLQTVGCLQQGRDRSGIKMNAPTKFFVGAVVNPSLKSPGQLQRMEKKIAAGASFFQTQANYDLEDFKAFAIEAKKLGSKVIAGILILPDYDTALFLRDNIPGIQVPQAFLDRMKGATDQLSEGIGYAAETMTHLQSWVDGFHLMTIREEELIPKVLERYDAKPNT